MSWLTRLSLMGCKMKMFRSEFCEGWIGVGISMFGVVLRAVALLLF